MGRVRALLACSDCGQPTGQWAGRCAACGAWGSIAERPRPASSGAGAASIGTLASAEAPDRRVCTGFSGLDRVLGGGLVPGSVALLAGEPGIGKSTLLLQLMARLSSAGLTCLMASGEESREQVAARAARLGLDGDAISFVAGRELPAVIEAARAVGPSLLVVDSIQTIRDPEATGAPGGTGQVRWCADALVGLAKAEGIAVVVSGHVTKDGDVAGPKTLEHSVDVVLAFDGDHRSGLRVLTGAKNRFGPDGEVAWFEMGAHGLAERDPRELLSGGLGEAGAATALPLAGRRALAVDVQALAVPTEGPARRQTAGLDQKRFSLVAAVVDRAAGIPLVRSELYGASSGGLRIDDPACDLAVAAALVSAVTGAVPPPAAAFVGEVALTGEVRAAPGMGRRLAAARAAGVRTVFAPEGTQPVEGVRLVPLRHVREAFAWKAEGGRLSR